MGQIEQFWSSRTFRALMGSIVTKSARLRVELSQCHGIYINEWWTNDQDSDLQRDKRETTIYSNHRVMRRICNLSYCSRRIEARHDSRQPVNRSVNVSLGIQYVVYELNDPPYV